MNALKSTFLFIFLSLSFYTFSQAPVDELLYICRDYLGSITHVVNSDGEDLQELSYDPWGRPRDPDTHTLYDSGEQPVPVLGRGYTGHEHLPEFNLINMNARLYDPALGRFLMADPVITDAGWGQGYNRYAYALGNPLKYVDPTGKSVFAAVLGVSLTVGALAGAYFTTASVTGYYNIARWDFRKTSTWLGLLGGAAVGAMSAGTGMFMVHYQPVFTFFTTTFVCSIISSAGLLGIQAQESADNRTSYNPYFTLSLGFASVDVINGEFNSFGRKSGLVGNLTYSAGTLGLVMDVAGFARAAMKGEMNIHGFLQNSVYRQFLGWLMERKVSQQSGSLISFSVDNDVRNVEPIRMRYAHEFMGRSERGDFPFLSSERKVQAKESYVSLNHRLETDNLSSFTPEQMSEMGFSDPKSYYSITEIEPNDLVLDNNDLYWILRQHRTYRRFEPFDYEHLRSTGDYSDYGRLYRTSVLTDPAKFTLINHFQ
jgi:RHS repeat-associated protein